MVWHGNGTVDPFTRDEQEDEIDWFVHELIMRGVKAETEYEVALEKRGKAA